MTEPVLRTALPRPELPLFDIHVHLGPSDSGELYYPDLAPGEYRDHMKAANVARACVFPPYQVAGYQEANARIQEACAGDDGLLPFARLGGPHQPLTTLAPWMIRRKIRGLIRPRTADRTDLTGFAGVKLLPHLDGLPDDADLERISDLGLPIVIHGGSHSPAGWIERAVVRKVRVPVVVAHLGAFPCDEAQLRAAVDLARRHDRVYLDTSAALLAEFLRYAVERVPEKLVFGSDCPAVHPLVAWYHVASAVRRDADLERIARGTAREIFAGRPEGEGW